MELLRVKMEPQDIKIRADFKLTCYKFEGIDAIKAALLEGEKLSTKEIPIKFKIVGSPIYDCTVTTKHKAEGLKLIAQALKTVEASIKLREGNFLLQTKPTVLGDTTGKEIQDQVNNMTKKEGEDDIIESDEEDHEEGIQANIEGFADEDLHRPIVNKKKNDDKSDSEDGDSADH